MTDVDPFQECNTFQERREAELIRLGTALMESENGTQEFVAAVLAGAELDLPRVLSLFSLREREEIMQLLSDKVLRHCSDRVGSTGLLEQLKATAGDDT